MSDFFAMVVAKAAVMLIESLIIRLIETLFVRSSAARVTPIPIAA
jgi:hypothetical protein